MKNGGHSMKLSMIAILLFHSYSCLAETSMVNRYSPEDEAPVVSFIDAAYTSVNLSSDGSCAMKHWPCIELEKLTGINNDSWEIPDKKVIDMTNNPDYQDFLVYRQPFDENGNLIRNKDGTVVSCNPNFQSGCIIRNYQLPEGTRVLREYIYLGSLDSRQHFFGGTIKVVDQNGRVLEHPNRPNERLYYPAFCNNIRTGMGGGAVCSDLLFTPGSGIEESNTTITQDPWVTYKTFHEEYSSPEDAVN